MNDRNTKIALELTEKRLERATMILGCPNDWGHIQWFLDSWVFLVNDLFIALPGSDEIQDLNEALTAFEKRYDV